ncbi:RNA-dependent RNA polymerase [Ligustrum leprosis virus]|uniref:RNA-dependent RNA polymerase n=1 Tax=Ligustrum leprosis virus TaxID=2921792 RepID=UPI00248342BE|nr:RNA-dependent RNA polymerase [Ligustrum leprosis virus]UNH55562.1 RNA-dependent RNA polymerase [Ligustrum leprosis virus]
MSNFNDVVEDLDLTKVEAYLSPPKESSVPRKTRITWADQVDKSGDSFAAPIDVQPKVVVDSYVMSQNGISDQETTVSSSEAKSAALQTLMSSFPKEVREKLTSKIDRGFVDNPDVDEAARCIVSSRLNTITTAKFASPIVQIPECIDGAMESFLNNKFKRYMLRLTHKSNVPHNNAAGFRRVIRRYMRDITMYDRQDKVPDGYDVLIKDIGSAVYEVLNDELLNIHCCTPDMDFRDHFRLERLKKYIYAHKCPPSKDHKTICDALKNGETLYRCENLGQNCYVKAPICMFIHSAYDLTAAAIVDCMVAADSYEAIMCLHFDSSIMSGAVRGENVLLNYTWEIVSRDGVKYFQQKFKNDTQACYTHRLDVYLDKFLTKVVFGSDKRFYLFELREVIEGTAIIQVVRRDKKYINGKTLTFNIPRTAPANTITVNTFEIVTGYENLIHNKTGIKDSIMKPVTIVVPEEFFMQVYKYGLTLDPSKFIYDGFLKGGIGISARRNLGGTTIIDPAIPIPYRQLPTFIVAMYLVLFDKKYEATQSLVNMKGLIDQYRKRTNNCGIARFFINLFQDNTERKHPYSNTNLDEIGVNNSSDFKILSSEHKLTSNDVETVDGFMGPIVKWFKDYARVHKRCPIEIHDSSYSVEYVVDIPDMVVTNSKSLRDEITIRNLCSTEDIVSSTHTELHGVACEHNFDVCTVAGDGNCLYNCFIKACLYKGITVSDLKTRLLDSPFFSEVAALAANEKEDEFLESLNRDGVFGNKFTLILIAKTFNINICVHINFSDESIMRIEVHKGNRYIHLRLKDNHYDLLKVIGDYGLVADNLLLSGITVINNNNLTGFDKRKLLSLHKVYLADGTVKAYVNPFQNCYKGPFLNLQELMFMELLSTVTVQKYSTSKFLITDVHLRASIRGLRMLDPSSEIIVTRPKSFMRLSESLGVCDFSLDSMYYEESFCLTTVLSDIIQQHIPTQCAVVLSDLCRVSLGPFESHYRTRTNTAERFNKIYLAWSALSSGGVAIFRIFYPEEIPETLNLLSTLFEDIKFFKPKVAPSYIVDGYLICTGRLQSQTESKNLLPECVKSFYGVHGEYFYRDTCSSDQVSEYTRDLCMFYSGGGKHKSTRRHSHNKSFMPDRSKIVKDLFSFVGNMPRGTFSNNFSSFSIRTNAKNIEFFEGDLDSLETSSCFHCQTGRIGELSFKTNVLPDHVTSTSLTKTQMFLDCGDFVEILSFLKSIYSGNFKSIDVISNCFLNDVVLQSFLHYCRSFRFVDCTLCNINNHLALRIICREKWASDRVYDHIYLLKSNKPDVDLSFLKVLYEHCKKSSMYTDKSVRISSKADAIRAGISVKKKSFFSADIPSDLKSYPKYDNQVKIFDSGKFLSDVKNIIDAKDVTSTDDIEVAEEVLADAPVSILKPERPVETKSPRLMSVYEFKAYTERELTHSENSIYHKRDRILCFTEVRDKDRLVDMLFPNNSIIHDELKLKDGVGIFLGNGKILKNSEPIVSEEDIQAIFDISTGSIISKTSFIKQRKNLNTKKVGYYGIFTSLIAHNQADPILKSVYDVSNRIEKLKCINDIEVTWLQAVAGAGKTTFLVEKFEITDLIVCPTVENRETIRKRVLKFHPHLNPDDVKNRIRTVNGFLVDYATKITPNMVSDKTRLLVDEAIMYHAGSLFVLCSLYGIKSMFCVGDKRQIPFVSRIDYPLKFEKLCDFSNVNLKPLARTFRSRLDVTYIMQIIYGDDLNGSIIKCLSKNQSTDSSLSKFLVTKNQRFDTDICRLVLPNESISFEKNDIKLLFFLKEDMIHFLNSGGERYRKYCCTVHQFQGNDAEYIFAFRLTYADKSIFNDARQCFVSISRHTVKMVYVSVFEGVDLITSWINLKPTAAQLQKHMSFSGGATTSPDKYVNYRSVPSVDSMKGDRFTTVGYNRRNDIVVDQKTSLSDFIQRMRTVNVDKNIVLSSSILDKFNQQRLKPALTSIFGKSVGIFVSGKTNVLSKTVFDVMELNGVEHVPDTQVRPIYDDDLAFYEYEENCLEGKKDILNSISYSFEDKYVIMQTMLTTTFPNSCYVPNFMDSWITYNLDLDLQIDDVSFSPIRFATTTKTYDCMIPRLSFCSPVVRKFCLVESLIAVQKRNRNVPQLSSGVSPYIIADQLFDSLMKLLDQRYYRNVHYGPAELAAWLNDQKKSVLNSVVGDFNIYDTRTDKYELITKNSPKPTLSDEACSDYAAPQVVLFQTKDINAVFCVIFRSLKAIVLDMLKHNKNIIMFADMDPDSFSDIISTHFDTSLMEYYDSLEIDIKKYDKSQDLSVLLFECKVMRFFGVPEELVTIWFNSHVESLVSDKHSSLKFKVRVQRRSGDGGTFLGNTLFLMAVIARNFDLSKLELAVFSGDDSLLVGEKKYLQCDSKNFSDLFNLDVKFFSNYKYYHFCSKFLIPVGNRWYFIPDPIKLLIRICRNDLLNWAHIDEYRISLMDSTKFFVDEDVIGVLSMAITDRYPIIYEPTEFLRVLRSVVQSETEFRLLFEEPLEKYPEFGITLPTDR